MRFLFSEFGIVNPGLIFVSPVGVVEQRNNQFNVRFSSFDFVTRSDFKLAF
jgi:hypothetical protein